MTQGGGGSELEWQRLYGLLGEVTRRQLASFLSFFFLFKIDADKFDSAAITIPLAHFGNILFSRLSSLFFQQGSLLCSGCVCTSVCSSAAAQSSPHVLLEASVVISCAVIF